MNKQIVRRVFVLIGFLLMLSTVLTFYTTFMNAYNNPEKTYTICIDDFNEAEIEFVLLHILLIICGIITVSLIYDTADEMLKKFMEDNGYG